MAKKRTVKAKVTTEDDDVLDVVIPNEKRTVRFNVVSGEEKEFIQDDIVDLHRLLMDSQSKALNSSHPEEEYLDIFATALKSKYRLNTTVTKSAAYRIADAVFLIFENEKKSTV